MSENSAIQSDNDINIQVVIAAEQFLHVMAVRAICFMEEAGLSVDQAIDGNDYQATHIIAYAKQEPIGATRIRWFRDFAKIERTAFRRAYRSTRILRRCSDFIYGHVRKKGYEVLVTHAEPQYAKIWERVFGFERAQGRPLVITEGHEPYVELVKRLPPTPEAITLQVHPKILFRIEGQWDKPSAFETNDEQSVA